MSREVGIAFAPESVTTLLVPVPMNTAEQLFNLWHSSLHVHHMFDFGDKGFAPRVYERISLVNRYPSSNV